MTVRVWIGMGLLLAGMAGGVTYWKLTSHTQVQVQVQVQVQRPPLDDATQRMLDEARQPLDTTGKPHGRILHLQ